MRNVSTLLGPTMSLASVFFVIFLFGSSASEVKAATITVNSNSDVVAADGVCTLREAITATQTDTASDDCAAGSGADVIEFAIPACPCTITLTNGALSVLLANGGDLTINGPGAAMLTVDGGGASYVFSTLAWANLSINGLTVTGGNPAGISKHNDGSLSLTGVAITGNTGSGILAGFGGLSLVDSTVANNTTAGDGAGVKTLFSSTVSITGSVISGNSAQGSGGGVWLHEHSFLSITNSRVTGNSAGVNGGGIHKGAGLTVTDSTISGNTAALSGGGIFDHQPFSGSTTVERSTISNNGAGEGGGVYILGHTGTGTLTVNNSTLSGNNAQQGGAIYAKVATTLLTNTTLSGNSSVGGGNGVAGGIYIDGGASTINSSTIYGNVAVFTGSILNSGGSLTINNTIVSHGDAPAGCPDINGEVTANYSLIRDPGCATVSGGNNIVGVDVDAMLGPLQQNGGSTKTHALLPGSPAINAGGPTGLTNDQRGLNFDRVVGTAADIGAFEVQPVCAGLSFSAATHYPTGGVSQNSVATGDFNNDGKLDLVVAVGDADYLSVRLGNGDGSFGPATNLPAGNLPWAVGSADLDGDGNLDLAVSNTFSTDVSVRLGNGDGTFGPVVNFDVGAAPRSLAVADFNGDGHLDLATTDDGQDTVSVLIGNGDGTFASATHFAAGDSPESIAAADFNGDGNIDLVTGNIFSNDITALLGSGNGTFAPPSSFEVGDRPHFVTAADLNRDGNIDVVTANQLSNDISVLVSNGNGTFGPATNVAVGNNPQSVAIADLDGDGELDLAVSVTDLGRVSALLGNGDGTFGPLTNFPAGGAPRMVTAADLNQDNKIDLITANVTSNDFSVLLNSCSSNVAPVANDDSYSVNEDGSLNEAVPGVLGDDTDGDGDSLTASLVTGPSQAQSFTLNPGGSFNYTPNTNFNGVDSFTYKVNDGTVDSNVATVTITVNPINDPPVVSATPETQPDVQYSDAIQSVTINASDIETTAANLAIAFSYSRNGGASVNGLPNGMTQGGTGGAWTVSGTAGVSAGTYVITASVTDSGDGAAAAVTSSDTFTIVVTRENAVAAPRVNNPVAKQVVSPGGTASGTTAQICFDITEIVDGSAGDTSLITSASVQISAVGGGGNGGITASSVSFSGGGLGSARAACFTLTLVNSPTNAYEVTLVIGGDYYTGSGTTAFVVFDPSAGFASGGGWIINPNNGYRANYGVNVKYLKNGNAQGSILYVEHRPDGDYKVKSTSLNSGGGFAIVPITGGYEAQIAGKANYVFNDVGTGNHSFIVRMIDKGQPGTNDAFGLKLINPSGQIVDSFTFNPVVLGGGNNQVPKK